MHTLYSTEFSKNHNVGDEHIPSSRLFCQFHAPQTNEMKKEIVQEMKKEHSNIRVIFATTALVMEVDSPYVSSVIHISPPSTLESYMQEIGRAGQNKMKASATLLYNKSDIAANKDHVSESMKNYCDPGNNTWLRKLLLAHFGFTLVQQSRCCSKCEKPLCSELEAVSFQEVRKISDTAKLSLRWRLKKHLLNHKFNSPLCMISLLLKRTLSRKLLTISSIYR